MRNDKSGPQVESKLKSQEILASVAGPELVFAGDNRILPASHANHRDRAEKVCTQVGLARRGWISDLGPKFEKTFKLSQPQSKLNLARVWESPIPGASCGSAKSSCALLLKRPPAFGNPPGAQLSISAPLGWNFPTSRALHHLKEHTRSSCARAHFALHS